MKEVEEVQMMDMTHCKAKILAVDHPKRLKSSLAVEKMSEMVILP